MEEKLKIKENKYFFGWGNIKKLFKEVINIYSNKKSYFSKKRLESGVAFLVAQWGMVFFLLENHQKMTTSDLFIWAGLEFTVSGYMINQIQKEKKKEEVTHTDEDPQL